jgi:hypothetical protein
MEKAKEEGVSLNQFVVYLLSKGVGNQPVKESVGKAVLHPSRESRDYMSLTRASACKARKSV